MTTSRHSADPDTDDSTGNGTGNAAPARVVLRPYASALPLGLLAFAVGMALVGAVGTKVVSGPDVALAGLVMATFVAPLQLVTGVLAFLGRDVGVATVLGLFSTSWVATGLLHVITPPGSTSRAAGIFLVAFAVALLGPTVLAIGLRPLLGIMLTISTLRAAVGGVYQLVGTTGWSSAEGIVAFVLAAVAMYNGAAFLLEDALQRPVLPTMRRAASLRATSGQIGDQLARTPGEAGVRHQL